MRVYKRRYGKYAGDYNIYDSVEEFQKNHPGKDFKIWNVDSPEDYQQGDWVEAEDGYLTEVIAIYKTSQNNDSATPTYFIRFPMAVFRCYKRKAKGWRIPCFYAQFTQKHSPHMTQDYYGRVDNKKLLFVAFILAGLSPIDALKKAFNMKGSYTINQLIYKIRVLLNDQFVKDELMKVISNIGMKFRDKMTEDQFVEAIFKHLEKTKEGSAQEFNALYFIGKTADYIEPSEGSRVSNGRQIKDAQVIDEDENNPPPLLSSQDE